MFKKLFIVITSMFILGVNLLNVKAEENATIHFKIKGNEVNFYVDFDNSYIFNWKINNKAVLSSENNIVYTLEDKEVINVEVEISDETGVIARGSLNNFTLNKILNFTVSYKNKEFKMSSFSDEWEKIREKIVKNIDFGYGYEFDYASVNGVTLEQGNLIKKGDVIKLFEREMSANKYTVKILFDKDINSDIRVSRIDKNDDIKKENDGSYILFEGKYVIEIKDGDYAGYTKTINVTDNLETKFELPKLITLYFTKASGILVSKKVSEKSEQMIYSSSDKFQGWEVSGIDLKKVDLTKNPLKFIVEDKDVYVKEILLENKVVLPRVLKSEYTYDKVSNSDLSIDVDLQSAKGIKDVLIDNKSIPYKFINNTINISKDELLIKENKNYDLMVIFDDISNTVSNLKLFVVDNRVYNISLINAKANKYSGKTGDEIEIKADEIAGKTFKYWQTGDIVLSDIYNKNLKFKLGNNNVKIEAIYEDNYYNLKVNGNIVKKKFNETVEIKTKNNNFVKWSVSGLNIDINSKKLNFKMPTNDVELNEISGYKLNLNVNEKDSKIELYKNGSLISANNVLEKGKYTLKVYKNGFKDYVSEIFIDKNIDVNVKLEKNVKWTCADEGKIWSEDKKACVSESIKPETKKPETKKPNNTTVKTQKKPVEQEKKVEKTPVPTKAPTPTPVVTPKPMASSKPEVKEDVALKKKNNAVWFIGGGIVVALILGGIISVIIKYSVEEED